MKSVFILVSLVSTISFAAVNTTKKVDCTGAVGSGVYVRGTLTLEGPVGPKKATGTLQVKLGSDKPEQKLSVLGQYDNSNGFEYAALTDSDTLAMTVYLYFNDTKEQSSSYIEGAKDNQNVIPLSCAPVNE